jgi:hypothetical protein
LYERWQRSIELLQMSDELSDCHVGRTMYAGKNKNGFAILTMTPERKAELYCSTRTKARSWPAFCPT